jgi:peptidyl-prolyl cis-trans isomerase A (cyclophilin A)
VVIFETSLGDIRIELMTEEAPVSTENFRRYVEEGFYDDTIFHRVIPGFVIQGGGHTEDMSRKPTRDPITNEADNGVKNLRGTLSMARTQDKDSATSQFFINLKDNAFLDHGSRDFGYAVFARVADGMDVVDRIAAVETGNRGGHSDVPVEPVKIVSARLEDSAQG